MNTAQPQTQPQNQNRFPPEHMREVFAAFVGLNRMMRTRGYEEGTVDPGVVDWPFFRAAFCEDLEPEADPSGMGVRLAKRAALGSVMRGGEGAPSLPVVVCRWADDPKIGVKWLAGVRQDAEEAGARRAVVVGIQQMTPFARTSAVAHGKRGLLIEFFTQAELCCSPLSHELAPRVRPLAPAEQAELLRSLSLSQAVGSLPALLRGDPVVRVLGLRPGQVVQVERPLHTVPFPGASVCDYRVVL